MFPEGFLFRDRIVDLDDYGARAAELGWSLRADQLQGGKFRADVAFVHTSRVQLGVCAYAGAFAATGHAPEGTVTFAVPLGESLPTVFNRRILPNDALVVIPSGHEISFRMTGPITSASIAIERSLVDRHAQALFDSSFARVAQRGDGVGSSAAGARTAVARMQAFLSLYGSGGPPARSSTNERRWQHLEALLLDDVLGDFVPAEPETGWSRRGRVVRQAEEYIRAHADQPMAIAELCAVLHVPLRTLDAAFRDCTGTSPKRFMLAIRLNAVRRRLARAAPSTTVTGVAADHGFYHFGRFASEYLRLFGELPSDTLRQREERADLG